MPDPVKSSAALLGVGGSATRRRKIGVIAAVIHKEGKDTEDAGESVASKNQEHLLGRALDCVCVLWQLCDRAM